MEIYVLDPATYMRKEIVEKFHSAIWVERYSKAGDVNLVVPPTLAMRDLLREGSFLALKGTNEIMLIENALVEDGNLKVTGNTITGFLNQRVIRTTSGRHIMIYNPPVPMNAVEQMNDIVRRLVVVGGNLANSGIGIDGARQVMTNLTIDTSGTATDTGAIEVTWPVGPLYDALVQMADKYSIGFKMYLYSADDSGYSLRFKAYKGLDRTRLQGVNEVVRFSRALDSLANMTELRSIAAYKNVSYAFPPETDAMAALGTGPGIAYDGTGATAIDFARRVLVTVESNIATEDLGDPPDGAVLLAILNQRAKDNLANNNYVKVLDGEVLPQNQYQYGEHYGMGDIVELDGDDGALQSARVTEYIRSKDKEGEKAYPTLSVIGSSI